MHNSFGRLEFYLDALISVLFHATVSHMNPTSPIRVRMAPSPTGHLHVGTAYPALFNYLFAKAQGGTFILRNEDTDPERSKPEFAKEIVEGLHWLGLQWDEGIDLTDGGELTERGDRGPYTQSQRATLYREYLERLLAEGIAYWCYCTKEELDGERARQEAAGEPPRYAGTCRDLTQAPEGKAPQVIRFKTPEKLVVFTDLVRGEIKTDATLYGDLVIARSLDSALYNFAVVVDDLTMGITHVIRGEDHISNTPKQILIFEALGATPPTYGHLSLLLAPDRTKLSKRRNKTSLLQYRDEGFLPEAMCNFLALMGWHQSGDREVFTLPELIEAFSTDRLQKAGSVFDEVKLRWINREHMKLIAPTDLAQRLRPFMGPGAETVTDATLEAYVVAEQGRADTLAELAAAAAWLTAYVPPGAQMLVPKDSTLEATRAYVVAMRDVVTQSGDTWLSDLEQYLLRESEGAGKRAVYWPLRVALAGLEKSPDPMTLGKVLGREAALQRIEAALAALSE